MGSRPDDLMTGKTPRTWAQGVSYYWPLICAGVLIMVAQWSVFSEWWVTWNAPYSYFSHGPLVPFIAGYMIWANRKRLATAEAKPCWLGHVVLIVSLVLFVFGSWTLSATIRAIALVVMLFGVLLAILGTRITRLLAVPVCFLFTMIPIAPTLLDSATGKLQLQSAAVAAKFLQLTGYAATLEGATIYSNGLPEPLIVGIPCSGLRTLISLITFTVFFVYMVRASWWKKSILLAASFPLSVFINSLRITMIGLVGFWTGSASAMHKFHDYSGYIGLAICFGILFGLAKLLKANSFGLPDPKVAPDEPTPKRLSPVGGVKGVVVVMCILGLACLSSRYASPIYPQTKGQLNRENIPVAFAGWRSEDVPIDKLTSDWLKNGDLLSRMYTDDSEYGRQVHVFITAARNPDAFHDPHMCIQGGGTPISGDEAITLSFDRPKKLTVKATLLRVAKEYESGVVIYWYMMGPDSMPLTANVWQRNRANMLGDLSWLMLHPTSSNQLRSKIESRQFYWYRFSTNVITDEKTDLAAMKRFIAEFIANTKGFGE